MYIDDVDADAIERLQLNGDHNIPDPNTFDDDDDATTAGNMADDRASIYLDTVSLASDFPSLSDHGHTGNGGNGANATLKSLSMSRQTIYHSAEDLQPPDDGSSYTANHPTTGHIFGNGGSATSSNRSHSRTPTNTAEFLSRLRGADAGEPSSSSGGGGILKRNGAAAAKPTTSTLVGAADSTDTTDSLIAAAAAAAAASTSAQTPSGGSTLEYDEVTAQMLSSSHKKTVTYSEWKSRVNHFHKQSHRFFRSLFVGVVNALMFRFFCVLIV